MTHTKLKGNLKGKHSAAAPGKLAGRSWRSFCLVGAVPRRRRAAEPSQERGGGAATISLLPGAARHGGGCTFSLLRARGSGGRGGGGGVEKKDQHPATEHLAAGPDLGSGGGKAGKTPRSSHNSSSSHSSSSSSSKKKKGSSKKPQERHSRGEEAGSKDADRGAPAVSPSARHTPTLAHQHWQQRPHERRLERWRLVVSTQHSAAVAAFLSLFPFAQPSNAILTGVLCCDVQGARSHLTML